MKQIYCTHCLALFSNHQGCLNHIKDKHDGSGTPANVPSKHDLFLREMTSRLLIDHLFEHSKDALTIAKSYLSDAQEEKEE